MEKINRRSFLGQAGILTAAGAAAALSTGCASRKETDSDGMVATAAKDDTVLDTGKMELRTNNGNGDQVSLLGYGCMRFTMKKDKDGRDVVDQDNVNTLVDYALAHGVNYFDSSPVYLQGQSEDATGIALSRHPRSSYYIATKLSNFSNASHESSMKMYHDSFKALRTDYIDYYLLHSLGRGGLELFGSRFVDNGMMDFLQKEREKGTVRQLGLSFHGNQDQFDQLLSLHDKYHWDFIQIQMNYFDWLHADGVRNVNAAYLYEQLDKREIPIVIMEPLQGGRLASPAEGVVRQMKERDPLSSPASWAFRFVGSYPRVLTALSGMVYMEHLRENLKTFMDFIPLTEEEKTFLSVDIADLMANYPTVGCNDCNYCMPCPYGVDIPGIFRHYNKCINEGTYVKSRTQEGYRKLRRAYLVSYDRAVETLRQAEHCIECRQCLPRCPQSIQIPRELHRIEAYIEKLRQETL